MLHIVKPRNNCVSTYFVVSFCYPFTAAAVLPTMSAFCTLRWQRSDEWSITASATGDENISIHRAVSVRSLYIELQILVWVLLRLGARNWSHRRLWRDRKSRWRCGRNFVIHLELRVVWRSGWAERFEWCSFGASMRVGCQKKVEESRLSGWGKSDNEAGRCRVAVS